MTAIKSDSNQDAGLETLSDHELMVSLIARIDALGKRIDHVNAGVHQVQQFIDEHRPALARALSLMDPGAGLRELPRHQAKAHR